MLWLLPYLGYAFAASAVASAAGYAAVTRFSVVQRVLVAALNRALGKFTDSKLKGGHTYHVERSDAGKYYDQMWRREFFNASQDLQFSLELN